MTNEVIKYYIEIEKMPKEWRFSTIVPLYKNKGDIQDCNNHR